jgi:type VI secretion system secreted protein Hcp
MDYMVLSILTADGATVAVNGECTLKGYENHIEVLSYSHGVSLPVQAGTSNTGRTTGRPNFGELSITKQLDLTSPALNFYCVQAKDLGTVVLKLIRQDATNTQVMYMTYALTSTLISSISVGGSGDIPVETVTFNYSKITWTYIQQSKDVGKSGTLEKYWDQQTNTGTT